MLMPYHVYILTTKKNTVLYTGVTSDLQSRIWQHKEGLAEGFSKKYSVNKLVYAEEFQQIEEAIHREKCIKEWKRAWKVELIEKVNPDWNDLYGAL
jgi:putative endonuclease